MTLKHLVTAAVFTAISSSGFADGLDPTEAKIVEIVDAQAEEAIEFLE